jgi:hypothetical protein
MLTGITLETITLDAPNNVAVFITEYTRTNDLACFKIRQVSHFPILSHRLSVTQHNHLYTDMITTECKQIEEEHSALPTEALSV